MTTKIKQTDKGTWIAYEEANSSTVDCMEYEEFDTAQEAQDWVDNLNEITDYYNAEGEDD
jgi:hypothetical protein